MAFYAFHCFLGSAMGSEDERRGIALFQAVFLVLIHTLGFLVLYYRMGDPDALYFYALQDVMIIAFMVIMRILYPGCSRILINDSLLLMSLGLLMLFRLSKGDHLRQLIIAVLALIITLPVPFLTEKIRPSRVISIALGGSGLLLLTAVLVAGRITRGSRLSISIGNLAFQPSEFVKLTFIFCLAHLYSSDCFSGESRKDREERLVITFIALLFAVLHVLILVLSKDLGGAAIFFMIYFCMTFVSLKKAWVPAVFALCGALSCVIGYKLFPHVRNRVRSWIDPFSRIEDQGYQITQSLFAIGTGSWFGMGLYEGSPDKIPIVGRDFIFSAISEEMGTVFSLCLILVIISVFLKFAGTAIQTEEPYFKLIATGISVCFAFQAFLNIGGVTRFIPLTGVTLPLVSYGGSSLLSTQLSFMVMQGIIRRD